MKKAISRNVLAVIVILVIILAAGLIYLTLSSESSKSNQSGSSIRISGAGSTFVAYFLQTAAYEYAKISNVEIDYSSVGSGAGIQQFLSKTVDFGASDAPLPRDKWREAGDALHIPIIIGGVVVIYNLPEYPRSGLNFTGEVLADIFLGKITKWNDPKLVALNPVLKNVNQPITVVHRSDGSGTTYAFTDYLSTVSQEWATRVGKGTSVNWPAPNSAGGKGNEGVAGIVKNTPYAIGYAEFTYAIKNNIPYGYVENPSTGDFVEPSIDTIAKTVGYVAITLPKGDEDWSNVSIIESFFSLAKNRKDLSGAYPIVSFTYVLIYKELSKVPGMNLEKAKALVNFLRWLVKDGQQYAAPLYYVPLPANVTNLDLDTLSQVTFNGKQL